jgi:protein dithiol oxidoreductase (disulfide-forming)
MPSATSTIISGLRHGLAVTAVLVIAACGGPSDDNKAQPTAEAPPTAPAQAEPAAPAPAAQPAAPAAQAPAPAAGVQESASEAGNGGEQLKLESAAPAANEPKWRFQEGQDFKVLTAAQGEAFWYGCPHCYQFDPVMTDYASKLPGDVKFVRVPVMWNPTNQIHARIYYTAQALGKVEEMHPAIFREIHVNKKMLTSEDEIQEFFGTFGVSAADFQKTFRSFAVEGQLTRAKELTERYQIRSVPIIIVNGKYSTDAPGIKSYDNMLEIVNELIERERRR